MSSMITNLPPLIQSRFNLLLAFYFELLASRDEHKQLADSCLQFVCSCIRMKDEDQLIVVHSSILCLKYFLEVNNTRSLISHYQIEIIRSLAMTCKEIENGEFFDLIFSILRDDFNQQLSEDSHLFR